VLKTNNRGEEEIAGSACCRRLQNFSKAAKDDRIWQLSEVDHVLPVGYLTQYGSIINTNSSQMHFFGRASCVLAFLSVAVSRQSPAAPFERAILDTMGELSAAAGDGISCQNCDSGGCLRNCNSRCGTHSQSACDKANECICCMCRELGVSLRSLELPGFVGFPSLLQTSFA
jgi:hypothetical protein